MFTGVGETPVPPHNPGCFSQSHRPASRASGLHRGGSHLMPQEDSQSEGGGLRLPAGLCFLQLGDLGKNKSAPGVAGGCPPQPAPWFSVQGSSWREATGRSPRLGAGVGWISDAPPGLFPSPSHLVSLHPLDSQGRTSPPSSCPLFSPVPAPAPPPSVPSSLYSCPRSVLPNRLCPAGPLPVCLSLPSWCPSGSRPCCLPPPLFPVLLSPSPSGRLL